MPRLTELYTQLKKRRVIRAGVVYIAVFWLSLQVIDILIESRFVGEAAIRWLIIGGVIAFPFVLVLSWFFEHPWHERQTLSVVGDLAVLTTVSLVAGLLAWQQWNRTFSQPVIAVLDFQTGDLVAGTDALAHHLTQRFRMLLASLSEIRVIEIESASHPSLRTLPMHDKAAALGADYLLAATVSQTSLNLRIRAQLYDAEGELVWGTREFANRIIEQYNLQNDLMTALSEPLNLTEAGLSEVGKILRSCRYPADRKLIIGLAAHGEKLAETELSPGDLHALIAEVSQQVEGLNEAGLFLLLRAEARLKLLEFIDSTKRSVQHKFALQDLKEASFLCRDVPTLNKLRWLSTRKLETDDQDIIAAVIRKHPNDAEIFARLAKIAANRKDYEAADSYRRQACLLNPLSEKYSCN